MKVIYTHCCGLDIHKKMIVACMLISTPDGIEKEIQTFSTMLQDLFRLRDWLKAKGCQAAAMESTGVFWKPIWNVLEDEMKLLLVNAQHMKAVPGRKTDIKDAEWIADLLQHGLLRASFVPPRPQRELRELTRYRSTLTQERTRLVNRIHKVLEDTNIKLTSVATDITGKSARAILDALLAGEQDPEVLASLALGRMRGKREQLREALQGTLSQHHRFLLSSQLRQLDFLETQLDELDQEIAKRLGLESSSGKPEACDEIQDEPTLEQMPQERVIIPPVPDHPTDEQPHEEPVGTSPDQRTCLPDQQKMPLSAAQVVHILDEVTGINVRLGEIIVAELGTNMDQFPSEAHLVSWVGLCPDAKISAGKRLSTKTGKGNRWLRQALIEVANAAARSKGTYLGAFYQRLRKRMGHKKAIMALAHRILVIIYHLLKRQQSYQELGPGYAEEQANQASKRWAIRRLEQLGYHVTLQTAEVA